MKSFLRLLEANVDNFQKLIELIHKDNCDLELWKNTHLSVNISDVMSETVEFTLTDFISTEIKYYTWEELENLCK